MENYSTQLTRIHLKQLGLSDYLVNEVLKDSSPIKVEGGYKFYTDSDIISGIEKKIERPKTTDKTKAILKKVLDKLQRVDNLIDVDFLRKLSPADKVAFLEDKVSELEDQEKELDQKTQALLRQAELVLSK